MDYFTKFFSKKSTTEKNVILSESERSRADVQLPKRLPDELLYKLPSEIQKKQFLKNLDLLHFENDNGINITPGDEVYVFTYLNSRAGVDKNVGLKMFNILSNETELDVIQRLVNKVVAAESSGKFKAVLPRELNNTFMRYALKEYPTLRDISSGAVSTMDRYWFDWKQNGVGYIYNVPYINIANKNYHLIADEHDLFSHGSSYIDDSLIQLNSQYYEIALKYFNEVGMRIRLRDDELLKSKFTIAIQKSIGQLVGDLYSGGEVREHTNEDWSYLVNGKLYLQGNRTWNALRHLNDSPYINKGNYFAHQVPFSKINELPGSDVFLNENRDLKDRVELISGPYRKHTDEFKKLINTLAMSTEALKLSKPEAMIHFVESIEFSLTHENKHFAFFFDKAEKEKLFQLYIDFYKRYFKFILKNYPKPKNMPVFSPK